MALAKPQNYEEDSGISRYQKDWDADAKGEPPDNASGKPATAASKRADANWTSESA